MKEICILFISILFHSFISPLEVYFNIRCDDYCLSVNNNNLPSQSSTFISSINLNLQNPITIKVKNINDAFGLYGKIDFTYFYIEPTNKFNTVWEIEDPCTGKTLGFADNYIGDLYDNMACTWKLNLNNICIKSDPTIISLDEQSLILNIKDMLLVNWNTNSYLLSVSFDTSDFNMGTVNCNDNPITSGTPYPLSSTFTIKSKGFISDIGLVQSLKITIRSPSGELLTTCEKQFMQCGEGCAKCNENEKKCLECKNDYAFMGGYQSQDCELLSEYQNNESYYYDITDNTISECDLSCQGCNGKSITNPDSETNTFLGLERYNYCIKCKSGFLLYDFENGIKNCVPNCTEPNKPYIQNGECVNSCDFSSGFYLKDENECVTSCGNQYKNDNLKKCVNSCGSNDYIFITDSEKKCVKTCELDYYVVIKKTGGSGNNKCSDSCSDFTYYTTETISSSSKQYNKCVKKCPANTYIIKSEQPPYKCSRTCDFFIINGNECVDSCPGEQYEIFDDTNKKCVSECTDESGYKYYGNEKKCVKECEGDYPYLYQDSNCVSLCSDYHLYIDLEGKKCVPNCNSLLVDISIDKCVSSCSESQTNNIFFEGECLSTCPDDYVAINGECKKALKQTPIDDKNTKIDLPLDEAIDRIKDNLDELVKENKTLIGDDYNVEIYDTSNPPNNNGVSSIDLSPCEEILRRENNIPDTEKLIVVKYEILKEDSMVNQVEYRVYRENGKELDLMVCQNINIEISYPYNPNIDLSTAEELSEKGIDVFNSSDPFFNDICYPYSIDGIDVPLEERRNEYYQNMTLCEGNCEYKGINYDTKRIICDCQIKIDFTTTERAKEILQNNNMKFKQKIKKSTNTYLSKCYNVFINSNIWLYNIGFWFTLTSIALIVITLLYLLVFDLYSVYSELNQYQKSNPPQSLKEKYSTDYFYHARYSKNDYKDVANLSINQRDPYDYEIHHKNINPKEKKQKILINEEPNDDLIYLDQSLLINSLFISKPLDTDNYSYLLATLLDQRTFCQIFLKILKEKNILLRCFYTKSKYELVSLNLCYFLFYLCLLFYINALLYTNDMILKTYYNTLSKIEYFLHCLYSIQITFLIMKVITYFKYSFRLFDMLVIEIKEYLILGDYLSKGLHKEKFRITIFYLSAIVFTLYILYYLTIFCFVYNFIQLNWFIIGWVSLGVSFTGNIIYSFLFSLLKLIATRYKNEQLYNILLYLHKVY